MDRKKLDKVEKLVRDGWNGAIMNKVSHAVPPDCACKDCVAKNFPVSSVRMTPKEAQQVAERFVNMYSDNLTIAEIKQALVVLANWYEDNKTDEK